MIALISVFAVVLLSLIVTRVAAVLLVLTGMSREAARFQPGRRSWGSASPRARPRR